MLKLNVTSILFHNLGTTLCPAKVTNCHVMGSLPYYLVSRHGTWYDAVDFCHKHNAVLASIPSAKHNTVLQTISTEVGKLQIGFVDVWLGLRKQEFQYNICKI